MVPWSSRSLGVLALSALLAHAGVAAADPPADADLQAARTLFADAETDEDAQRWGDALVKLKDVARIKLTPGIRYHMALCEEHLGNLAAALKDYSASEDQAHAERASDVNRLVGKRVIELSVRVPQLVVTMAHSGFAAADPAAAADASITVDGEPVVPGIAARFDPGDHVIEVHASGHDVAKTPVTLRERDTRSIEVDLGPLAPPPAPTPPLVAEASPAAFHPGLAAPSARQNTLTIIMGGAALGLTVGGIAAFLASGSVHENAVVSCSGETGGADACSSQRTSIRLLDGVALGAWIGAAAAATVAIVSFTRAHAAARGPSAGLAVGPGALGLRGRF